MQKLKTFFEQVPLEVVKKIVEENGKPDKPNGKTSPPRKAKLEKEIVRTSTAVQRRAKS